MRKHILALFPLLAFPSSLPAQAWVNPKGQGTVTVGYINTNVHDHVDFEGKKWDKGRVNTHAITVATDYSLTDRLALRVSLPYVFGKYTGKNAHTGFGHEHTWDDGSYHSAFQNFTADLRYQLKQRQVLITPFVSVVQPSHNYEYYAHAAVGSALREYHIGVNAGRLLNPILPRASVEGRYSYAFVQRVVGHTPNRSNLQVLLGYYLNSRLSVTGSTQWFQRHYGIGGRMDIPPPANFTVEEWPHHDQISKASLLDVSGIVTYQIKDRVSIFGSFGRSIFGTSGHFHASVPTFGISWTFDTPYSERKD